MGLMDDLVLAPIYTSDFLAVDAIYTPHGGSPTAIRVKDRRNGVAVEQDRAAAVAIRPEFWVRKSDVPAPTEQDTIALDGQTWRLRSWRPALNGAGIASGELRLEVVKV